MSHHHRPVRMRGLAIAGLALACGCATRAPVRPGQLAQVGPSSRAEAPSAEEVTITAASGDFEQRAALATQLLQERAYVGADEQLQKLTASAEFETVGPGRQYAMLKAESWTAAQRHDLPRAEALLQRVTALPTALPEDWRALSLLAAANQDWTAAAQSLATLAQHSAPIVSTIESRRLKEIVQRAPVAGDLRYHLLTALFGAQPHLAGTDLSNWWRDLALMHLEHHELAAAIAAVRAITDPYGVVIVFADNRFAPVRHALKGELDVAAAAQRKIESSRLEAEADPARLQLRSQLSDALMDSLRYSEALEVIDAALAKADAPNGRSGFADYTTAYVWSLDTRADALFALGRWEEAVSVLRAAAALDEDGQPNVSQVINLAFMYARLDQPVETRNQLAALRPDTVSAYGHMQWVHAQLLAATALGDSVEITRCLEFMRAHQSDARVAYQAALVQTGRLEEAATVLISRLAAPEERADALLSVQRYDPAGVTAATPRSKDFRQQWTRLLQREDVLKAIREVGQIGSYPLRRP